MTRATNPISNRNNQDSFHSPSTNASGPLRATILEMIFSKMEYEAEFAGSSEEALEILKTPTPKEVINYSLEEFGDNIALSTSLGMEDQVLTHMIQSINPQTKIFTLDTGRLFPETYDLIDRTTRKYKINLQVFFPDQSEVEQMVAEKGINLFSAFLRFS